MSTSRTWSLSSGRPVPTVHEVWLELSSGSRVLVGRDLPDVPTANELASRWIARARDRPEELHETRPGSGCVVRGSAIIAIKAQPQVPTSRLRGPRTAAGWWSGWQPRIARSPVMSLPSGSSTPAVPRRPTG